MWCQKSNFEDISNHLVPTDSYTHANTHIHNIIMWAWHPKMVGKHINMQKRKKKRESRLVDSAMLAINIPSMHLSINDKISHVRIFFYSWSRLL